MADTRLIDLASVIRSKNAGPFLVTLDVIFDDWDSYVRVRDSAVLTPTRVGALYRLDAGAGVEVYFNDPAKALKVTFPSRAPSGHFACTDVYGAQQYIPLLALEIPDGDPDG
ncbi:MAG: DUF4387 domain-containing protein [Gaiellaceae bacterium]